MLKSLEDIARLKESPFTATPLRFSLPGSSPWDFEDTTLTMEWRSSFLEWKFSHRKPLLCIADDYLVTRNHYMTTDKEHMWPCELQRCICAIKGWGCVKTYFRDSPIVRNAYGPEPEDSFDDILDYEWEEALRRCGKWKDPKEDPEEDPKEDPEEDPKEDPEEDPTQDPDDGHLAKKIKL
jgi:hypothetical protein